MSPTHDMIIDNSTGANVRADLNNALAALVSNSSSSSEPSTKYAYMWWADTTTGILKIRNSANNAWVELLQLDGTLTMEDGSASTPGLAFRDDLNTGIFSSAADTFNVATGGVERMELGAATVFNEDGANVDFRIEGDNNANLFYLDAGNDRVGIGLNNPNDTFHVFHATDNLVGRFESGDTGAGITLKDNTHVTSLLTTNGAFEINVDSGGDITGESLAFKISGSEKARFDSSGRLLLGTTTEGEVNADDLTIASSGNTGMTIRSGTSNFGSIYFSDGTSGNAEYRGLIAYNQSSDYLQIFTAASERMRIDSSGNVGIGTSTPTDYNNLAENLVVATSSDTGITIATGTSSQGSLFFADGTSGSALVEGFVAYEHNNNALKLGTGNAERMRIDSSGHLKFAGTTEEITLQTSDGSDNGYLNLSGGGGCSQNRAAQVVMYGNERTDQQGQLLLMAGNSGNANGVVGFNTGGSERMRIDSSGNVMIGTTSTTNKFHVEGTTSGSRFGVDDSASGITALAVTNETNADLETVIYTNKVSLGSSVNIPICFHTNGKANEKMRIDSSGNVGIGTTSPEQKLHVDGGSNDPYVRIQRSGAGDSAVDIGGVQFKNSSNVLSQIVCRSVDINDGVLKFSTMAAGTSSEKMEIDQNGITTITQVNSSQGSDAFIIVRPNASTSLQNDMVQFECGNQGRGKIVSSSSDGSSPQFAASSDYRLKENIRNYTQGYDNIKAIPVKLFDMITDGAKDIKGWVAHEVQSYIPEAVIGDKDAVVTQAMVDSGEIEASELGNDIIQTLSYGAFMPDVVGALQTAIAKIEVLETKVAALEAA